MPMLLFKVDLVPLTDAPTTGLMIQLCWWCTNLAERQLHMQYVTSAEKHVIKAQ